MKTFTVIAYVLPDGAHHVETVQAADPDTAGLQLRAKLELQQDEFEIVGIAEGTIAFLNFDPSQLNMASFTASSP
ncbi:MAG: hypothetical protein PSU94_06445 [Lacunisphaera sp.]|nr:hypothetical protein [Lacunisphaera sp.]